MYPERAVCHFSRRLTHPAHLDYSHKANALDWQDPKSNPLTDHDTNINTHKIFGYIKEISKPRICEFFTCQGIGLPTWCKSSVCESESNFFRRDFPRFFAIFRPLDDITQRLEACIALPCIYFVYNNSIIAEIKLFSKLFQTFLGLLYFRHLPSCSQGSRDMTSLIERGVAYSVGFTSLSQITLDVPEKNKKSCVCNYCYAAILV